MKKSPAKEGFRKAKKKSVGYWKLKAWKVFSEFIRRREADEDGMVHCVTCRTLKHWKKGDAGHFLPGRFNANLFDPRGCHFQCKPCNGRLRNRVVDDVDIAYEAFMLVRYGSHTIMELRAQNKTSMQFTVEELQELINHYKLPKD